MFWGPLSTPARNVQSLEGPGTLSRHLQGRGVASPEPGCPAPLEGTGLPGLLSLRDRGTARWGPRVPGACSGGTSELLFSLVHNHGWMP